MNDTLPKAMMAIVIREAGGPDVLIPGERPVPYPYEHEILIKVAAAGINRPDILQRQGHYPPPQGAVDIPGLEVSGTVIGIGRHVEKWSVGDKVTALVSGGGYAPYCKVHMDNALAIPAGLSMIEAAALPETFFTVWSNVFNRAHLQKGETILIHGGTSGIGTTAIQLAKAFGARVFVTAGSDEKCAACIALGAELAINYNTTDFISAVKQATDGVGVAVILDMVGGDYVERNWIAAAVEGRIVQIATLNGPSQEVNFARLMQKRLTHTGSTLRARSVAFKANIADHLRQKVWPLIEAGTIKPVVDSTFSLHAVSLAHAYMEQSKHIGKIILTIEDD